MIPISARSTRSGSRRRLGEETLARRVERAGIVHFISEEQAIPFVGC